MSRLPLSLALSLLVLLAAVAVRAENFDVYAFDTPADEARFDRLTHELRCPKCQNQSIADSNAPIAKDLRERTYELVKAGRSDDEIVGFLKERYGEFITYRPPFNAVTAFLWGGPVFLLVLAATLLLLRLRRRASADAHAVPVAKTEDVQAILSRYDGPGDRP